MAWCEAGWHTSASVCLQCFRSLVTTTSQGTQNAAKMSACRTPNVTFIYLNVFCHPIIPANFRGIAPMPLVPAFLSLATLRPMAALPPEVHGRRRDSISGLPSKGTPQRDTGQFGHVWWCLLQFKTKTSPTMLPYWRHSQLCHEARLSESLLQRVDQHPQPPSINPPPHPCAGLVAEGFDWNSLRQGRTYNWF